MKLHNQKNKMILIASSLFILLMGIGIFGGYTYASFTDKDSRDNGFVATGLKGTIKEDFPKPGTVELGKTYTKEVTIKNEEHAPFFVRVLVLPEMTSQEGILLPSNLGQELVVDIGNDWQLGEDGFYYYKKVVDYNETTTPLFTKVKIPTSLADTYNNANLTINVKSETVSAAGTNYRDAYFHGVTPTETDLNALDTLYNSLSIKGGN